MRPAIGERLDKEIPERHPENALPSPRNAAPCVGQPAKYRSARSVPESLQTGWSETHPPAAHGQSSELLQDGTSAKDRSGQRNLAFSEIAANGLAQRFFRRSEIQQVIDHLECQPQVRAIRSELKLNLLADFAQESAQAQTSRKQAGGLTINQF